MTEEQAGKSNHVSTPQRDRRVADLIGCVPAGPDFDDIACLAADTFESPIGLVTLIGDKNQDFLGKVGTDQTENQTDKSFCIHLLAAEADDVLVIEDALDDPRVAGNPVVTGEPHLRFYAGAPVFVDGLKVGSVCAFDVQPRVATDKQIDQLKRLAGLAGNLLKLKETATKRSRENFRHDQALKAAPISSWLLNTRTGKIEFDVSLFELMELDRKKSLSLGMLLAGVHDDYRQDFSDLISTHLQDSDKYTLEFPTKSGERWLLALGQVHEREADGAPLLISGAIVDMTASRTSEQTTQILLKELNHRVGNTLALLQSLATQTLRRSTSSADFMTAFSGRLQALSRVHQLLSDSEWNQLSIHELVAAIMGEYATHAALSIGIAGEDVAVQPDEGLALGLVLHELVTNAARHGALSIAGGKVSVDTRSEHREDQDVLIIDWREENGPAILRKPEPGFGSILIERGLQKIIGSKVDWHLDDKGVHAHIEMPVTQTELSR